MVRSVRGVGEDGLVRGDIAGIRRRIGWLEGRSRAQLNRIETLERRLAALEGSKGRQDIPVSADGWRDRWLADPDKAEALARKVVADQRQSERVGQVAATFLGVIAQEKLWTTEDVAVAAEEESQAYVPEAVTRQAPVKCSICRTEPFDGITYSVVGGRACSRCLTQAEAEKYLL